MNDPLASRTDVVVPFIFEGLPVRGALIQLQHAWARMQLGQSYARPITTVLGQAAAATGLIAQSLKFDGTVTMQISGDGPLSMLVMQSTDALDMRGMANARTVDDDISYPALVDGCRCAITVDSGAMEQPYQGVVEMLGESLGSSIENYFTCSAQITSRMFLVADHSVCGGIMLQQMADRSVPVDDDWRRLGLLADTLRTQDFATGIGAALVGHLFAEDDVRIFQPRPAAFRCRCSTRRAEDVLRLLGEEDTRDSLEERGRVDVVCEYCGRKRSFDAVDISRIFRDQSHDSSETLH